MRLLTAMTVAALLVIEGCPPGTVDDTAQVDDVPCESALEDDVLRVDLYEWNGEDVYYYTTDCCDHFNPVLSTDCSYLCAPDGGFTGGGDDLCPDFFDEATFIQSVWAAR